MKFKHIIHTLLTAALLSTAMHANGQTKWIEGRELTIYGRNAAFKTTDYNRLPPSTIKNNPELKEQSNLPSGISIRFTTNADTITIRWKMQQQNSLPYLTPCAANGFDLYVNTSNNDWQWIKNSMESNNQGSCVMMISQASKMYDYALYLPVNAIVDSIYIGVNDSAYLIPVRKSNNKPIVLFGGERIQGTSASRSGLSTSALIERRTNHEVINLGLDTLAYFEEGQADMLVQYEAACFVIDINANISAKGLIDKAIPFIDQLSVVHDNTPIFLVAQSFPDKQFNPEEYEEIKQRNHALERCYKMLLASGIKNLYFVPAIDFKAVNYEHTFDGKHLNDIGNNLYAQKLSDIIIKVLGKGR